MATLADIRAATAKLLGPFYSGSATSGTSTTLVSSNWPFTSTLAQNDLFQDYYLMRPNATATGDISRIVQAYTATTGTFQVDQSYTNAPASDSFELHGHPIEPYTALTDIINQALKRCFLVVEIKITPTLGNVREPLTSLIYGTTTFSWLTDPRWVYQAGYLGSAELRDQTDPYLVHPLKGIVEIDSDVLYFRYGVAMFAGTETIYLRCIKPAYNACRSKASNGIVTGITNATNAAPIIITTAAPTTFTSGDPVIIDSVGGTTSANGHWRISLQGGNTMSLQTSTGNAAYTSGGTIRGDFGNQAGLTLDGDDCPVDANWVAASAAVIAWDRYGHLLEQTANQKVIRDATKAAAWFNELTEWNFQEPLRTLQPIHMWGPPRYGTGVGW